VIDMQTERETRRATLEPWRCDGSVRGESRCNRMLMMLDWHRPSFIQVKCPSCGTLNTFVEAHRPV
jgi:phage FluMu protein Com